MRDDNQWRHTREIAYMVYCSIPEEGRKQTIFERYPLPDDPTPAEIAAAKSAAAKAKLNRANDLINKLAEQGHITLPKKKDG